MNINDESKYNCGHCLFMERMTKGVDVYICTCELSEKKGEIFPDTPACPMMHFLNDYTLSIVKKRQWEEEKNEDF